MGKTTMEKEEEDDKSYTFFLQNLYTSQNILFSVGTP